MSNHEAPSNAARRTFLGGIAGAAALLPIPACLAKSTPSMPTESTVATATGGYRLTSHIRTYYRSAMALYR